MRLSIIAAPRVGIVLGPIYTNANTVRYHIADRLSDPARGFPNELLVRLPRRFRRASTLYRCVPSFHYCPVPAGVMP